MKKPGDTRFVVRRAAVRKHRELFRNENRQYERLLRLLNKAGAAAERLRHALDEVDRGSSVAAELAKAREIMEAELGATPSSEATCAHAPRSEATLATVRATNLRLIDAVQHRARENQLLVCRALAMVQAIINVVGPAKTAATDASSQADTAAAA